MRRHQVLFQAQSAQVLSIALSLMVLGCGNDAEFTDSAPPTLDAEPTFSPTPPPPPPVEPPPQTALVELEWQWACDADPAAEDSLELTADLEFDLSGGGLHTLNVLEDDQVVINLNRQHCKTSDAPRDIVFIIDVSGSMNTNDPKNKTTGSCGRFEAVKSILDSLSGNKAVNVAAVTFDDKMVSSSAKLMPIELFEASSSFSPATLCVVQGGTNYPSGLSEAINIFADSQPNSVREVYFISDGKTEGKDGVAEATILKDPLRANATIATLMIEGDDAGLLKIASRDPRGNYLHRRTSNATDLIKLIGELSTKQAVKGSLSYRGLGEEDWYVEDFSDTLDATEASLTLPALTRRKFPKGMQFKVEYVDNRGVTFATEVSTIGWKDPGSKKPKSKDQRKQDDDD